VFAQREAERHASRLLDQQFWCWGRDIRHPSGDLLMRAGFSKRKPSARPDAGSSYTKRLESGVSLTLWGFGVCVSRPDIGAVYLHRFGFKPLMCSATTLGDIASPRELPALTPPRTGADWRAARQLVTELIAWIARYEHDIIEEYGWRYRQECLAARGRPEEVAATDIAAAWERLGKKCRWMREHATGRGGWTATILAVRWGDHLLRSSQRSCSPRISSRLPAPARFPRRDQNHVSIPRIRPR
jgi:hypothetical protein